MASWATYPDKKDPPAALRKLAEQVERDGGSVLAIYEEPIGSHWQIFCILPLEKVEPVSYQRNLSPTHLARLKDVLKKVDRYVDPIVVVSPKPGSYLTPNGNHRREALGKLRAKTIPAILIAEPEVAHCLLALNTEKAPNMKDRALEVIRLYRVLAVEDARSSEAGHAFHFDAPHFATLGLLYEANLRFAGGAFAPILRRVDKWLPGTLKHALGEREARAEAVRAADERLGEVVAKLKKRGLNHPYLKPFVLARTTPLTRARKTLPSFAVTFKKLAENLAEFDVEKVRYDDVARSAVFAAPESA